MKCENAEHWFRASDYCKENRLSPFDAKLWNKALEATKSKPKAEWKFPCYGKMETGTVVYFTEYGVGKVVLSNCRVDKVHTFSYYWVMSAFTPCTLEAKEIKC